MIDIIYGFVISIFVILSGCFIRLGLILRELETKNNQKLRHELKTCATCEYSFLTAFEKPCCECILVCKTGSLKWERQKEDAE